MTLYARIACLIISLVMLAGCDSTTNAPDLSSGNSQQSLQAQNQAKLEAATRY